jgi:hypothetical protein
LRSEVKAINKKLKLLQKQMASEIGEKDTIIQFLISLLPPNNQKAKREEWILMQDNAINLAEIHREIIKFEEMLVPALVKSLSGELVEEFLDEFKSSLAGVVLTYLTGRANALPAFNKALENLRISASKLGFKEKTADVLVFSIRDFLNRQGTQQIKKATRVKSHELLTTNEVKKIAGDIPLEPYQSTQKALNPILAVAKHLLVGLSSLLPRTKTTFESINRASSLRLAGETALMEPHTETIRQPMLEKITEQVPLAKAKKTLSQIRKDIKIIDSEVDLIGQLKQEYMHEINNHIRHLLRQVAREGKETDMDWVYNKLEAIEKKYAPSQV